MQFSKIKPFIHRTLFRREWLALQAREAALAGRERELERRTAGGEIALIRAQLGGFSPGAFGERGVDPPDILEEAERDGGRIAFLTEVHELAKNKALTRLSEWLIRNQVAHAALSARDAAELNFARASINGIKLIGEEVDRIEGIWQAEHAAPEQYDPHRIT